MSKLTCSRHAIYLHTIYVKYREIHILSTIQILGTAFRSLNLVLTIAGKCDTLELARALIDGGNF
jgi:hypothetical protein